MLNNDHVFSDNLTEEELEKLLAELDNEESTDSKKSSVEPTLEQRLSTAMKPVSHTNIQDDGSDKNLSVSDDDWITKLLDDEDSQDNLTNDDDLEAMVAEINQDISKKDIDVSELVDTSDIDEELSDLDSFFEGEESLASLDEQLTVESKTDISPSENISVEAELLLEDDLADFELSDDFLNEDKNTDAKIENVKVGSDANSTIEDTDIADVDASTLQQTEQDNSHYDVDNFLDSSLLDSSLEKREDSDFVDDKANDLIDNGMDDLSDSNIETVTSDSDGIDSPDVSLESDTNDQQSEALISDAIENDTLNNQKATTQFSPHLQAVSNTGNSNITEVNQSEELNTDVLSDNDTVQFFKVSGEAKASAQLIQKQVKEVKEQLRLLQDTFRDLTDTSAEMIAETRHLQNACKDDFSVTYEQMHQLRKQIIQTCRDIDGIPSMIDIVEEAIESDLYVAETRTI